MKLRTDKEGVVAALVLLSVMGYLLWMLLIMSNLQPSIISIFLLLLPFIAGSIYYILKNGIER